MVARRQELHRLVDELSEAQVDTARQWLELFHARGEDPFLRALAFAPLDDEPVTAEEEAAVDEARADERAGRVVTHEELKRRLGL